MANYREINALASDFFEKYGGMMTLTQVGRELGVGSRQTAKKFVEDREVPGVAVGERVKYESRLVAKAIVSARGFC